MRIEIEVFGEQALSRELLNYADRGENLYPFWRWWFTKMRTYMKRGFDSEGRTMGATWRRLKPLTIKKKARLATMGYPYGAHTLKKLHETTHLRKSLTTTSEPGAIAEAGANSRGAAMAGRAQPGRDTAVFGTAVPYAVFHQRGTVNMVARPVIRLTEKAKKETVRGLQTYMSTGSMPPTNVFRGL